MIDWTAGYTCQWRVFEVNPDTWADAGLVGGLSRLKVSEDEGNSLVQTGSMTLTSPMGDPFRERYLRVALTATANGTSERVDVCTMLWSGTSGTVERGVDTQSLRGSSVLYPASRTSLPDLAYAPSGVNCAEFAAGMLRDVLKAPVSVTGDGFVMDSPLYFEPDERVLDGARRLLEAGGYRMQVSGRGEVEIMPEPSTPSLAISQRMVTNPVKYTADLSAVPNRLRAVSGSQSVTVQNDDPDSRAGYQQRGYWDDVTERNPTRVNGETLTAYARRRLEELSVLRIPYSYQRRWVPEVHVGAVVSSSVPSMRGTLVVARQVLTCDRQGISVQEESYGEEALWRG